jgi:hypothetical protein
MHNPRRMADSSVIACRNARSVRQAKKAMKPYSVSFEIKVHDKATSYPEVCPIYVQVKENLPANVDPQKYIRQRLAEELSRNFKAMNTKIENTDEGVTPDADPLTDTFA